MKTSLLCLSVLLFATTQLSAQFVTKLQHSVGGTGDDRLTNVSGAADGSIYIGGTSNSNQSAFKSQNSKGGYDYWVIKVAKDITTGNIRKVWDRTVGGVSDDGLVTVVATNDNSCLLVGTSLSGISSDKTDTTKGTWLVKLDKQGMIQWQKTIVTPNFNGIVDWSPGDADQCLDGGYILLIGDGLVKTNATGDTLWTRADPAGVNYQTVRRTNDGGYIMANGENILQKTNGFGIVEWTRFFSTFSDLKNFKAIQTQDGGYAFYGLPMAYADDEGDVDNYGRYVFKTDGLGNDLWHVYDSTTDFAFTYAGVAETANGEMLLGSNRIEHSGGIYFNAYDVDKIDKNGNKIWQGYSATTGGLQNMIRVATNSYLIGGDLYTHDSISNIATSDYYLTLITDTSTQQNTVAFGSNKSLVNQKPYGFTAYPNPVKDRLFVQNAGKTNFIITDENGKTVLTKSITGKGEIDVSRLTSGVYYFKNTSTGTSQKIVIIE